MTQSTKILASLSFGVVAGLLLNLLAPDSTNKFLNENIFSLIGQGFIRLLQLIVVPLIFVTLAIAMSKMRDLKKIGRYSSKLLGLYLFTSSVSLIVGIALAKLLKPGVGVEMVHQQVGAQEPITLAEWLMRIIPRNPFEALSSGNMLQVIICALLVGLSIAIAGEKAKAFLSFLESALEVVVKMTQLVLKLAPLGVFALMASLIATQGLEILKNLSLYIIGLILGVIIMGGGIYSLLLLLVGLNPFRFWKAFHPAFAFAFATASSSATLPVAMENAEKRYGMGKDILTFAIPFGMSLKKDGAALLQGFSALFVAQMAGITLTTPQYIAIVVSTLFASFSTAGIPAGGVIMMSMVLSAAGLPLEGVVILAGVDRFTDTFRTSLNVVGPTANAAILERWEKATSTESSP